MQFFPDLNELEDLDICPSLKNFEFSSDKLMDLPFLKLQSDVANNEEADDFLVGNHTLPPSSFPAGGGFGDGGFGGDDGFGDDDDVGFGGGEFHATEDAGGESWGDEPIMRDAGDGQGFEPLKDLNGGTAKFVMALSGVEGENILSYFDERGSKNWAGPEHWRIQRIKKGTPPSLPNNMNSRIVF